MNISIDYKIRLISMNFGTNLSTKNLDCIHLLIQVKKKHTLTLVAPCNGSSSISL